MTADERRDVEGISRLARHIIRERFKHLPAHVDRDDLYQAAMEGACRARLRWDASRGVPWPLFAGQAIFRALQDNVRRERPGTRDDPGRKGPVSLDGLMFIPDGLLSPFEERVARELVEQFDELPVRMGRAVKMSVVLDMPQAQIAAVEGVGVSAISQRLSRARRLLCRS